MILNSMNLANEMKLDFSVRNSEADVALFQCYAIAYNVEQFEHSVYKKKMQGEGRSEYMNKLPRRVSIQSWISSGGFIHNA